MHFVLTWHTMLVLIMSWSWSCSGLCGLHYNHPSDPLRVTAEVKHNPTSTIVCKAQGEWNGTLEFTYSSGETKVIDTTKLAVTRKRLRPVERQGRTESRSDTPGLCTPCWPTRPIANSLHLLLFVSTCNFAGVCGSTSPRP